ncbi:MAG TPA: FHA domain-containing protein [Solirubrobacteraceae bacterium]|nr:FHA domain-containing protein [Solirubrobacteraceae bacterium]
MDSLTSGTIAGAGSFRCRRCGYMLTLDGSDTLSDCPGCGGRDFVRASLFSAEPTAVGGEGEAGSALLEPASAEWDLHLAHAREAIEQPGEYLCYEEGGEVRTVALTREWTRIGRSLVADVRFDDPTVSRRHALIVRQPDGVRLLDDRSLNGVFVNGARVEGKALLDGDEIIVGRYRLMFVSVAPGAQAAGIGASQPGSVQTIG